MYSMMVTPVVRFLLAVIGAMLLNVPGQPGQKNKRTEKQKDRHND